MIASKADKKIRQYANCFKWLNLVSISISVGVVSSFSQTIISKLFSNYSNVLLLNLFLFLSAMFFGVMALRYRGILEGYLNEKMICQSLERSKNGKIVSKYPIELLEITVRNNFYEGKKVILNFVMMLLCFVMFLSVDALDQRKKESIEQNIALGLMNKIDILNKDLIAVNNTIKLYQMDIMQTSKDSANNFKQLKSMFDNLETVYIKESSHLDLIIRGVESSCIKDSNKNKKGGSDKNN